MAGATKTSAAKWDNYKSRYKKQRVDSEGRKCPKNLYLRGTSNGLTWCGKITIDGRVIELKSSILESDPQSREKAIAWIAQERTRLEAQFATEKLRGVPAAYVATCNVLPVVSPKSVNNIGRLELERFEAYHAGSPHYATLEKHLYRIAEFFGGERDVSTITMHDVTAYIRWRRSDTTARGKPPIYGTIYRELDSFMRGIKTANKYGIFNPPYILPIDKEQRVQLKKQDGVHEKQRSHIHTEEECKRWIQAAKGTRLEHHVYLAYATGMRSKEMEALTWQMIERTKAKRHYAEIRLPEWLYRSDSKVDDRPIPISETTYEYLAELAKGKSKDEPILRRINGMRAVTQQVSRRAGGELYITLRDLRASFGQRVYNHSRYNIKATQIAMRHRSVETTMRHYLRSTDDDMATIVSAVEAAEKGQEERGQTA